MLLVIFAGGSGAASLLLTAPSTACIAEWFAHHDGRLVRVLGALTGPRLQAAGLIDATTGQRLDDDVARGIQRLQAAVVTAMNKANPDSGYQVAVDCVDLARVPASQFLQFSLLLR